MLRNEINVAPSVNVITILMEHITFRSMKKIVYFTVFYFLLCYYEGKVCGTDLNDQIGDAAADLESKSGGKGELLKEQIVDPDTYRNVVRRYFDMILHIITIPKA